MDNFLIIRNGQKKNCGGVQHNIFVRRWLKMSLKQFLKGGGVRVKISRERMAIEAGKPLTSTQKRHIRYALKHNDIFSLVVSVGGEYSKKDRFRPIRSL